MNAHMSNKKIKIFNTKSKLRFNNYYTFKCTLHRFWRKKMKSNVNVFWISYIITETKKRN